ncbi:unnamed protein product, partial [Tetraodon nigroviridis]
DEEAIVDHGKSSFTTNTNYEKDDLESHRAVYVGVHVPLGRESRRRHRHRGHRHHRKRKERSSEEGKDDGRDSPTYGWNHTHLKYLMFILTTSHHFLSISLQLALCGQLGTEWGETATWLKFEEDVEDGGERWSKPYVATLSLHSLFELRSCILNGTVMLDMRVNSIEEIAGTSCRIYRF